MAYTSQPWQQVAAKQHSITTVECVQCCYIFKAVEGSICEVWKLCAKCYLDKQKWYVCQDCGMKVSTDPCFICEKGLKRDGLL